MNLVPDFCDIYITPPPDNWEDCNENVVPDKCEIPLSTLCLVEDDYGCRAGVVCGLDSNGNCVPDECDCPVGVMEWATTSDPPDGIIDACQPHPLDAVGPPQGISVITVQGPPGARKKCFSLCETRVDGTANDIQSVDEWDPMTYTITPERPLAAGAVTEITYTDESRATSSGVYTSLPGDSDASGRSQDADIPALVSCCLNEDCPPPSPSTRSRLRTIPAPR